MTFPGPTLKHFILRQQVLNLYRGAIRASRGVAHHFFTQWEALTFASHTRSRDKEGDYCLDSPRIRPQ